MSIFKLPKCQQAAAEDGAAAAEDGAAPAEDGAAAAEDGAAPAVDGAAAKDGAAAAEDGAADGPGHVKKGKEKKVHRFVVSFRGTQNTQNMLTDLKVLQCQADVGCC